MLQDLINESFQTFLAQAPNARLILLHPRSRYRSTLVAKLINAPGINTYYYALGPDDINLGAFLAGITHDVANQHPTFGRNINLLPKTAYDDFDLLVSAFVQDLAEMLDEDYFLILDEYDRGDTADDIQLFVQRVVENLPANCAIVLNSRTLPRLPWVSLIARKYAVLLNDSHLIKEDFYEIQTEGDIKLDVFALGPGHVDLDGKLIENWEGHLPRLLFFFSLDRPVITRSEICQAFWPELATDQAVNVFHVTKRRLHKALDMDVLIHGEGYYRINPNLAIRYDVVDFTIALMDGRDPNNPDRVAAWQRAIDMYRGPFLQGHNDWWILERRAGFQAGYLEALSEMGQVRLQAGRLENALSLFKRALAEDASREDLHREVMRLYATMGRRSEAAAHYQSLLDDLRKAGRQPAQETQALYAEIMD